MKVKTYDLRVESKNIRKDILKMVASANASHVGSALSCVDILCALYFEILNINPKMPQKPDRDKLIISKGHGGAALLATLARRGYFPVSRLKNYCLDGSTLTGHTMIESVPGVEATTGSLGHGLSLGVGMALAAKSNKSESKTFVVLSDGELDEGSTWEAIMAAGHLGLDNLIAIVDYNKIQSFGRVKDVLDLEPLAKKWVDFKWMVEEVDGHDYQNLLETFKKIPFGAGRPSCVVAHTIKGRGVSFMENTVEWHYRSPDKNQLQKAIEELK